jgi:hypothetical protein
MTEGPVASGINAPPDMIEEPDAMAMAAVCLAGQVPAP